MRESQTIMFLSAVQGKVPYAAREILIFVA